MKLFGAICGLMALLGTSGAAIGQTAPSLPRIRAADGSVIRAMPIQCVDNNGHQGSCSGTPGGDATAANQSAQTTVQQAIRDEIGALTSPAAGSVNARLSNLSSVLGSPFQAGGSIGNTAFGSSQVGTWNIGSITTLPPITGSLVQSYSSPTTSSGNSTVSSSSATGGQVLKTGPTLLFALNVTSGATAGYVIVHNSATVPADGALTSFIRCYALAPNTSVEWAYPNPIYASAGITVSFSTTGCYNKTASSTASIAGDVR